MAIATNSVPDQEQEALFNMGHSVGELTKKLFSNGKEIDFAMNWDRVSKGTAIITPNIELYRTWILTLNEKISDRISNMTY